MYAYVHLFHVVAENVIQLYRALASMFFLIYTISNVNNVDY